MSETKHVPEEKCPICGKPMRIAFIVPRVAGHAEIRSFKCMTCGEVMTKSIDKVD